MANKRKNRKRSSSQRIDYTKGGRVGYQEGGIEDENLTPAQKRSRAIANNRNRGRNEFDEVRRQDRLNQQVNENPPASVTPTATTQNTQETNTTPQDQSTGEVSPVQSLAPERTPI